MANFLSFNHINYAGLSSSSECYFLETFSIFKEKGVDEFSLLTCNLKKEKLVSEQTPCVKCLKHTHQGEEAMSGCSLPPLRSKWQQGELSWVMPSPFVMWFFLRTRPPGL